MEKGFPSIYTTSSPCLITVLLNKVRKSCKKDCMKKIKTLLNDHIEANILNGKI